MKKKFLALMLSLAMVMSMTACGGSDSDTGGSSAPASDSVDETEDETEPADEAGDETGDETDADDSGEMGFVDANGLLIALPAEFGAVETGIENLEAFSNGEKAFITVSGPMSDGKTEPDQLTEEAFAEQFEQGGYTDVVITNVATVEQTDGATAATRRPGFFLL